MTYTNNTFQYPKALKVSKPTDTLELIVHGQGVLFFNASESCTLTFHDVSGVPGLKVSFTDSNVIAHELPSNKPLVDLNNTRGLIQKEGAYYWLSLDSQNQRIYAGIGEARKETVIYSYQFPQDDTRKINKAFLESLTTVKLDKLHVTKLLRDPITNNVPLIVKNTEELTMDDVAANTYISKANLSSTSQKLYDCISGKNFVLDSPDFPTFSQAIEHSIVTPGKWCHKRLKQKASEFDKDKPDYRETYLRITLGENNGESPGIPYVMEIWPVEHYSPIHNHGSSSAIIRVLHGSINVALFPFLSEDNVSPFGYANFKKDDITWISPTLNQVHQLKNLPGNKDTCITIQCYMYEDTDQGHYDYFDYLDGSGKKQQYEPDSDMDFLTFKETMKKEWLEQVNVKKSCFWF